MIKITLLTILFTLASPILAQNLILDGRTIPLNSLSNVIISPAGDVIIESNAGDLVCSSPVSGSAPILSNFNATPATVAPGGNATISWTLANDATVCTKSGAWSGTFTGNDVTNGTHSSIVTNITTSSMYSLQCSNNSGTSQLLSDTVNVNVVPTQCVNSPPILSGAEDRTILATATPSGTVILEYDGTFAGFQDDNPRPWPGGAGESIDLSLTKNQYISAKFNSGNITYTGKFNMAPPNNLQGPSTGAMSVAISECPGDFASHLNQVKCLSVGGAVPGLNWSTDPNASSQFCHLEKNKDYYLNIVHSNNTENDNYATSDCTSGPSFCGILANNIIF